MRCVRRSIQWKTTFTLAAMLMAAGLAGAHKKSNPPAVMDESQRAVHVLNRLTFGPTPGEVEQVRAMGVDRWIELQLHPEKIDDHALDARLAGFRTLEMTSREMVEAFPPPILAKAVAQGRLAMPTDPAQRAAMESEMARVQAREARKAGAASASTTGAIAASGADSTSPLRAMSAANPQSMQDATMIRTLPSRSPQMPPTANSPLAKDADPGAANPERMVISEMQQAKLLRAVYSTRQLQEVMTDFWFNHFNVFVNKGADKYFVTSYERDVLRPRALGKFQDLLIATAQSPAMLFYLDNWQSVGPQSQFATGQAVRQNGYFARAAQQKQQRKAPSGLNENYARELMELHTLGVDGGYTQKDVTEVARVFTGWTLRQPRLGNDFEFDPRRHDPGPKLVLGHKIKEHGEQEGVEVLQLLARQPATAHFISRKLAMRFVSDDPPAALVDRMAETFLKKDGDIREVLRTMFRAPEFWAPQAYRAKVKTPLEFVASTLRATGAEVQDANPLTGMLYKLGMPLYQAQPPTGYSMKAETWVNSSALLGRMNFALALAAGRVRGTQVTTQPALFDNRPATSIEALTMTEANLLEGDVSEQTHATVLKQLTDSDKPATKPGTGAGQHPPPNMAVITGLLLGSPEFQRR